MQLAPLPCPHATPLPCLHATRTHPPSGQIVVTDSLQVARHCSALFGCYALHVPSLQEDAKELLTRAGLWAKSAGLWDGRGALLVLSGKFEANADMQPELSVVPAAGVAEGRAAVARMLRRTQSITA
ncbi:hypothetical protein MNEG_11169 [Monoraphidium neglectum]|uniref:Uncharacterized protein n=1 Tax=Monoraphidium neglectum TaxID=145388 RepID=A0A0D2MQ63_9CHLO|nr:hypothetical protein MNEG_11169 [Monoraphidium neglectum]KIY96795.1 hypothetical protein MNEG_11169 [Monoraphidium neglectum]|eukprot:XP_013895815.1 hypothetical protein MNEG_11169 [Monoraphidium neglectum]